MSDTPRRWKAIWILSAITAVATGCTMAAPRDPATVSADAQCRAWARNVAQAEYAPDARSFAAAPRTVVPGASSGAEAGIVYGLAGVGSALTDLGRQGRERELYRACMTQTPAAQQQTTQPARAQTWLESPQALELFDQQQTPQAARQQMPKPARTVQPSGPPACEWGMYWDGAIDKCIKIGASPRPLGRSDR